MGVFRNVGTKNSEAGVSSKRKNKAFTTQRKVDIKAYWLKYSAEWVAFRSRATGCKDSLQTEGTATPPAEVNYNPIHSTCNQYHTLFTRPNDSFRTYSIDWTATYTVLVTVNLDTKAHRGTQVKKCMFSNNTTVFSSFYMPGIGLKMPTKQQPKRVPDLMLYWPCIMVYQYSETNVIDFF
jgi:hypothetical protein